MPLDNGNCGSHAGSDSLSVGRSSGARQGECGLESERPAVALTRGRRAVVILITVFAAVAGLAGGAVAWHVATASLYSAAYNTETSSARRLVTALDDRTSAVAQGRSTVVGAQTFLGRARPAYVPVAAFTALKQRSDALHTTVAAVRPVKAPADRSFAPDVAPVALPWDTLITTYQLVDRQKANVAAVHAATHDTTVVDAALDDVLAANTAVWSDIRTTANTTLAGDTLATYQSQIGLKHALAAVADSTTNPQFVGRGMLATITAIETVRASQAAGVAAKADPAYPIHAEIEAYARSISHGVHLDFVWAHTVNGKGDGWLSGTTQAWSEDGGWAIISLNFNVANYWNDGQDARALVAHEVGHSQAIRVACRPLYSGPVFDSNDEMWATAWSISMGFDVPGSGIEAYGRPTDQQIATAAKCR